MMRLLLVLLLLSLVASAQTRDPKASDPRLHADAIKLVEVSGARKRVQDSMPQSLADGKKAMLEKCPTCSGAFADEWVKRMSERLKAEDFVDVFVEEYEKFFTDSELSELISIQQNAAASSPPVVSDALKAKMTSVLPSLQSEIIGRCTQIGAKLGAEVAQEIASEHPEYTKQTTPHATQAVNTERSVPPIRPTCGSIEDGASCDLPVTCPPVPDLQGDSFVEGRCN